MTTFAAARPSIRPDLHMRITWLLVSGLFILRIPLMTGVPTLAPFVDWLKPLWELTDPIWDIGTYFLTAVLIWWERDRLADFHIDKVVLFIFILGKPVELLLSGLPDAQLSLTGPYYLYLPIAFGLALALLIARPALPKIDWRVWVWLVAGLAAGIALAAYFAFVFKLNGAANHFFIPTPTEFFLIPAMQMLTAGLGEEPFFRGFLWGSLRKTGMKEVWIWLAQAGLFMLGHVYALLYAPYSFWFIVPVGGLVLGLLAWRSRSIAPGIIAHGLANGLSQFMA